MKNHRILAGAALAAALAPATHAQTQPGIASGPDTFHRQFLYFLPKAAVAAAFTQQITVRPVGTGKIEVELDANGAPTALEYGSGSGGGEIATVMDSGLSAAATIHGSSTAATQDKIDAIKAQNELDDLLSGDSTP
jgi:hypothetical protein